MKKIAFIIKRITYWLAWKLAGKRIWDDATEWAALNIYLYSGLEKGEVITLPEGITVADEQVILTSGQTFDGGGHILTQAVNKLHKANILIPAGVTRVTIKRVLVLDRYGNEESYAVKLAE